MSVPSPPFGSDRNESTTTDPAVMEAMESRRRLTEGVAWVYVPTRPDQEGVGSHEVRFELRQLADGNAGLPVFTELELLVAQLGDFQPWRRIAVLDLLIQVSSAHVPVVVNPILQEGADRWTAADIEAWKRNIP
jgi:type III secretion system (T3SS) SseB-like protein